MKKKQDETVEMLNELYQNADMGQRGTELLMERTKDANLSTQLHGFVEQYAAIKKDACAKLSEFVQVPKPSRPMTRASMWMGVNMNTMIDQTPSHIAEMLIEGNTMGIVKGEKNKKSHQDADPAVQSLEDNLIQLEQDYMDTMKQFLQ